MTAYRFFKVARAGGIRLEAQAGKVRWLAPTGAMTPDLRAGLAHVKQEMLAMLIGDYAQAALMLVLRETGPGERRDDLAEAFDERLAICEIDGGLNYGEACRVAYRELARAVERGGG